MYNREVTSSRSMYYVRRSGKGLTISMSLRTKIMSNRKHNSRTAITESTPQELNKLLKKFKNLPYLGSKKNKVQKEPTESYFLLVKHISNLIKRNKQVLLRT